MKLSGRSSRLPLLRLRYQARDLRVWRYGFYKEDVVGVYGHLVRAMPLFATLYQHITRLFGFGIGHALDVEDIREHRIIAAQPGEPAEEHRARIEENGRITVGFDVRVRRGAADQGECKCERADCRN
jgi:hypothetical protein